MTSQSYEVTAILDQLRAGEREALKPLFEKVYRDLNEILAWISTDEFLGKYFAECDVVNQAYNVLIQ